MRIWPPKHVKCRPIIFKSRGQWCGCKFSVMKRRLRCLVQYSLLVFLLLILIIWIGKKVQDKHAREAPSTVVYYQTPKVCGLVLPFNFYNATNNSSNFIQSNNKDKPKSFEDAAQEPPMDIYTFPSEETARTTNGTTNSTNQVIVGHCGDCGQCSNPHDIEIYDETKNTLLKTATRCAKRGLLFGRRTATKCIEETVGFTMGCTKCWVENIMCDLRYCIFTCFWNQMFSQVDESSANGRKELNPCTKCDEKRCGPGFIQCAGANRRRVGILSDIERNDQQEVCAVADENWWQRQDVQEYWESTVNSKKYTFQEPKQQQEETETLPMDGGNTRRFLRLKDLENSSMEDPE